MQDFQGEESSYSWRKSSDNEINCDTLFCENINDWVREGSKPPKPFEKLLLELWDEIGIKMSTNTKTQKFTEGVLFSG